MMPDDLSTLARSDVFGRHQVEERIAYLDVDDEDDAEEIEELQDFLDDAGGCDSFIAKSYFEDYARELAEDIGAISDETSWPATCIDWKQAASDLATDYTSVELDGYEFYCR